MYSRPMNFFKPQTPNNFETSFSESDNKEIQEPTELQKLISANNYT
mgnify:CR=1 FL=1